MWVFSLLFVSRLTREFSAATCSEPWGTRIMSDPGDIIIGGLFPIHKQVTRLDHESPYYAECGDCDVSIFLQTLMMIYSIEKINESPMLPHIKLGYEVYDTCADVNIGIKAALRLMEYGGADPHQCFPPERNHSKSNPRVKVVIGEMYSEVSIAVARLLALPYMTQISHASTSEALSVKTKYPSFLRTVSSDKHQTKAMAKLIQFMNWETVAVIGSDDEYGKYGSDSLMAEFKVLSVCVHFKEILPAYFSQNDTQARTKLKYLIEQINSSSAEAIVLFTKDTNVQIIFEEIIKMGINRTWIASDAWSNSAVIAGLDGIQKVGRVFGFMCQTNNVPGFKDYIRDITLLESDSFQYLSYYNICSNPSFPQFLQSCSHENTEDACDRGESYSLYLAVNAIARALRNLLNCSNVKCEQSTDFSTLELLEKVKQVNFTLHGTLVAFDENGDMHTGYDILVWDMSSRQIKPVGEFTLDQSVKLPDSIVSECRSVTVSVFNCFKTCSLGHGLVPHEDNVCCKFCQPCQKNQYSLGKRAKCKNCEDDEYASKDRSYCLKKPREYLEWNDAVSIVLLIIDTFGILCTVLVTVVFLVNHDTPIVKGAGGHLCFIILLALLACFCSSFTFVGLPTDLTCRAGLPLFGICFTICVSGILANLFQIFVGFAFSVTISDTLRRLNNPAAIVGGCTGVQVALCAVWLILNPPSSSLNEDMEMVTVACDKGSKAIFGAMLGYIASLCLICFIFAYKGKSLPDLYKNASLITVSMMIYLVVWILFIPLYLQTQAKYSRAIEASAILVSNYSLLCCHFFPKTYIIVFRKELNNQRVILDYIRKHYENIGVSAVTSSK